MAQQLYLFCCESEVFKETDQHAAVFGCGFNILSSGVKNDSIKSKCNSKNLGDNRGSLGFMERNR